MPTRRLIVVLGWHFPLVNAVRNANPIRQGFGIRQIAAEKIQIQSAVIGSLRMAVITIEGKEWLELFRKSILARCRTERQQREKERD